MIGVLGISHKTAPLEIREKFSVPKIQVSPLGEQILRITEISEVVIISTCNRTEIYYYHDKSCIKKTEKQLINLVHSFNQVTKDYSDKFYSYSNRDAVNHLFSVTSGLESMVFGEDQVVNQVKEAYIYCTDLAFTEAVLMRLFQKAFETGKKVRSQTDIQKGATSVAYFAVEKSQQLLPDFENSEVLIVGTGETGLLALQKLQKLGITKLHFCNRTFDTALALAKQYKGKAIEFDDLIDYLPECDIVLTATAAGTILINKEVAERSSQIRKDKTQLFIDLSVPRNVDKLVANVANTQLLSVDSLQIYIDKIAEKRKACKKDADLIIDTMTAEYFSWLDNRSLRPVIKAITANMQQVHKAELENYQKCFSDEVYKAVDEYAGRLTQKYIRTIIKNLRELNENGEASHSLKTINDLFEFEKQDKLNEQK